jgi:uncharacterized membrane protein (UPF0127 family)
MVLDLGDTGPAAETVRKPRSLRPGSPRAIGACWHAGVTITAVKLDRQWLDREWLDQPWLDRRWLDDPPPLVVRRLTQIAFVVAALGVFAFLIVGANRPANPYLVPASGRVTGSDFSGFGAGFVTISAGVGLHAPHRPLCVLLATTTQQQERGLMKQTSLHGWPGMVFQFQAPTQVHFYMRDTLIPLSIAWFAADGGYVSSTNMEPCPSTAAACPTFAAGAPYQTAIEVEKGQLSSLGIGPGSSLQVGGPCSG